MADPDPSTLNIVLVTFILSLITFIITFYLTEKGKRDYLLHEKLLSMRFERFESILQELYLYVSIYLNIQMILQIQIVDISDEVKAKIINVNRLLEKLFLKSILNESVIWDADTTQELEGEKWKLMNFLQNEGLIIYNDIQVKSSGLHLILEDRLIQIKAAKIAENISNYISEANKEKDYSDRIRRDLNDLKDSMKDHLPPVSLKGFKN
ncbi:MAG: hypothetical protein OIN86_16720 [Candidatus Methanoperedens sp.]|nr:hypothetical protein [Candidatus Methanoperedens sp.]CAG1003659.1 hypothetical protein METP1_03091 [Methanosarcinales archaeon]